MFASRTMQMATAVTMLFTILEQSQACEVPNQAGYVTSSAGGTKTISGFAPSGVTCASGFTYAAGLTAVGYTVCASEALAYTVYGCEAVTTTNTTTTTTTPHTTTTRNDTTTTTGAPGSGLPAVSTVVTLTGLDFSLCTEAMKTSLITKVKDAFLASLTGYVASDITVVLSAGSVIATVTITPKVGSTTAALTSSMTSTKAAVDTAVLTNVKTIAGLSAIFETGITIDDLTATSTAPVAGGGTNTTAAPGGGDAAGALVSGVSPTSPTALFMGLMSAVVFARMRM